MLCHSKPCYTLGHYSEHAPEIFNSNSEFVFLPGEHSVHEKVIFRNISNITLRGYHPGEAKLLCTNESGMLIFETASNIFIANITLTECGGIRLHEKTVDDGWQTRNVSAALWFRNVANVELSEVTVSNTTGFGLLGEQIFGKVHITDSTFWSNLGSYDVLGGNIWMELILSEEECNQVSREFANTSLHNLSIVMDSTVLEDGSRGLGLHFNQSCYDTHVTITGSKLISNGKRYPRNSYFGGNLYIWINETSMQSSLYNIFLYKTVVEDGHTVFGGGGISVFIQQDLFSHCFPFENTNLESSTIHIIDTKILNNDIIFDNGGGVRIVYSNPCRPYYLLIRNTTLNNNMAPVSSGGNVFIEENIIDGKGSTFTIEDCIVSEGFARLAGGGVIILLTSSPQPYPPGQHPTFRGSLNAIDKVVISNTRFLRNDAPWNSGGLSISFLTLGVHYIPERRVRIENSEFTQNTALTGPALGILNFRDTLNTAAVVNFLFINTNFSQQISKGNIVGTVHLESIHNATFVNCNFNDNNVSALFAISSNILLKGNIIFQNNSGYNGGGLVLCANSYIYLQPDTHIHFLGNRAQHAGGAIYVEEQCFGSSVTFCFFRIDSPFPLLSPENNIKIDFINNTAGFAGSALYGGNIDTCSLIQITENGTVHTDFQPYATTYCSTPRSNCITYNNTPVYSTHAFHQWFDLSSQPGVSTISSDPIRVCLCGSDLKPNCSQKQISLETYSGRTLTVEAVVVGQRNGVVPGAVKAILTQQYGRLGNFQQLQSVGNACITLNYTIFTNHTNVSLDLQAERLGARYNQHSPNDPTILINITDCPHGFSLVQSQDLAAGNNTTYTCGCAAPLMKRTVDCDIETGTIQMHRPPNLNLWVGYHNQYPHDNLSTAGVMVHDNCPMDYCKLEPVDLNLEESPEEQCAFGRAGILCGSCKDNLSAIIGSSKCWKCSNSYTSLLLAFAIAGLALVFLLTVCNLTVSEGTINGLIFYANIIQVNRATFFPKGQTNTLTVFISWLNLDLGIQTCFYRGMDVYAKTWLQFVFPLYIWLIVFIMVVTSHYSISASRVFGRRNAIKVLATLFLLSYAKLLRVVISVLSFTFLTYPDVDATKVAVWLYDGNIQYLHGKHIPLFIVALVSLMFLILPYSLLLTFFRCLNSQNVLKCTYLIRLKPFFDTYAGPYKDRYHFWTGLLLHVRSILFLIFALNSLGDPTLNLSVVVAVCCCLLAFGYWGLSGVYQLRTLNVLEAAFFLNLATLSVFTIYTRNSQGSQAALVYLSVSIALLTFLGILVYHVYTYVPTKIWWRKLSESLKDFKEKAGRHDRQQELMESSSEDSDEDSKPTAIPMTEISIGESSESGSCKVVAVIPKQHDPNSAGKTKK